MTLGCGEESPSGTPIGGAGPYGDGIGTRPLAPPKFLLVPGEPGAAVGIRAVVTVDGVELTTNPTELGLLMPEASAASGPLAAPSPTAGHVLQPPLGRIEQGILACPMPGAEVEELGTINGNVIFMSSTLASGSLGFEAGIERTTVFAREGMYQFVETAETLVVPPDFFSYGVAAGFGGVTGDGPGTVSARLLTGMEAFSFSYGITEFPLPIIQIGVKVGFTFFTRPLPRGGLARAFRTDLGLSYGISAFPLPVGGSVELASQTVEPPNSGDKGVYTVRFIRPWNDCGAGLTDQNALEYVLEQVRNWSSSGGGSLEDSLAREAGTGMEPLFESLGTPGEGGLTDNVPAASNADFYAEFLSSSDPGVPGSAPNTSMDGVLKGFLDRIGAAGDDTAQILRGARQGLDDLRQATPSLLSQAALQNEALAGLQAAGELRQLADPVMAGRMRFIAPDITRITALSGEVARVVLTSEELAALVERPVADVVGATVLVNAGTQIVDVAFTLGEQGVALDFEVANDNLLVRLDVDLSTADGSFPADVDTWIVRPSMRLITVEAGPAAGAIINGPRRLPSGAPASLSVQVVDANGRLIKRPFSVRFIDAEGRDIGQADSTGATAMLQFIPEPSAPVVSMISSATITQSGTDSPGLSVLGTGFSANAAVSIDAGEPLEPGTEFEVQGPEEILVILPEGLAPGSHQLVVQNPGGLASDSVAFEVP